MTCQGWPEGFVRVQAFGDRCCHFLQFVDGGIEGRLSLPRKLLQVLLDFAAVRQHGVYIAKSGDLRWERLTCRDNSEST